MRVHNILTLIVYKFILAIFGVLTRSNIDVTRKCVEIGGNTITSPKIGILTFFYSFYVYLLIWLLIISVFGHFLLIFCSFCGDFKVYLQLFLIFLNFLIGIAMAIIIA